MKLIYLLSNTYKYEDRMYVGDTGKEYASSLGLKAIKWGDFDKDEHCGSDAFIDTQMEKDEIEMLEELIRKNTSTQFLMSTIDPYWEHQNDSHYIHMLRRLNSCENIRIVSRYQPEEVIKELTTLYGIRALTLNYVYEPEFEIPLHEKRRSRKVIYSGATDQLIYPERYEFWRYITKSPFRIGVDFLKHPGYSTQLTHKIIGNSYLEFISKYRFMFVSPSRCELEFLKYREAAYAGALPIGIAPKTFTKEMNDAMIHLDPINPIPALIKAFTMSKKEWNQRIQSYRNAFLQHRGIAISRQKLKNFLAS